MPGKKKTNIVLANIKDYGIGIVHGIEHERPLVNGDESDINPLERFVNATSLTDILLCAEYFGPLCESSYISLQADADDIYSFDKNPVDFPRTFIGWPGRPTPSKLQKKYFPNCTRTEKGNIKHAIECWGLNADEFTSCIIPTLDYNDFECDLLSDWLLASHDLRVACTLLVSFLEQDNTRTYLHSSRILREGNTPLQSYYEELREAPANEEDADLIHEFEESGELDLPYDIQPYLQQLANYQLYALAAFSIMLESVNRRMQLRETSLKHTQEKRMRVVIEDSCQWGITRIWEEFSKLFESEKVTCCQNCGKVIVQKRKGVRKTCSGNCRNLLNKKKTLDDQEELTKGLSKES